MRCGGARVRRKDERLGRRGEERGKEDEGSGGGVREVRVDG